MVVLTFTNSPSLFILPKFTTPPAPPPPPPTYLILPKVLTPPPSRLFETQQQTNAPVTYVVIITFLN